MARNLDDLSELEREFELEMDDEFELGDDSEVEDSELDDQEFQEEFETDLQGEAEYEEDEFELGDQETGDYAERFFELSQREFESESELDNEIEGLVNEMERDYFFGGLGKRLKRAGKGLLKKGIKLAAGQIPALQAFKALTDLSRGGLKGLIKNYGKTLITAGLSGIPGGSLLAGPAVAALGLDKGGGEPQVNQETWNRYVDVSREAFNYLAENLHENADHPLEASRLATKAFQTAVARVKSNSTRFPARPGHRHKRRHPGRRVVYLGPGETLVIKRR
jgi:hypothetical protein